MEASSHDRRLGPRPFNREPKARCSARRFRRGDLYDRFHEALRASFFESLKSACVTRLIDVRLNNVSQLAGFAKRDDLRYFLNRICSADYVHEPLLAPNQPLLDAYKKHGSSWADYEIGFRQLMAERRIEERIPKELFEGIPVLLCSEYTAQHCHRRLVCDYLNEHWGGVETIHI